MKRNPYTDKSLMEDALMMIRSNLSPYPFPYISGQVSTLGGEQKPSLLLTISFDEKSTWKYHILENSTYAKFHIDYQGKMEMISGHNVPKFRRVKVKSAHDIVTKLHMWGEKK